MLRSWAIAAICEPKFAIREVTVYNLIHSVFRFVAAESQSGMLDRTKGGKVNDPQQSRTNALRNLPDSARRKHLAAGRPHFGTRAKHRRCGETPRNAPLAKQATQIEAPISVPPPQIAVYVLADNARS